MNKLITALLLTVLIPATSFASKDGNELLAECTKEGTETVDYMDISHCYGYIEGIADVHYTFVAWGHMQPLFCVPKNVTGGQVKKIVVKWLDENPEKLHLGAGSLVSGGALYHAFPYSLKDDGTRYCPE